MVLGLGGSQEPTMDQVHEQQARRPSTVEVINEDVRRKSVDNRVVTGASQLTTRQSIVPVALVTLLFFLWGFAYGLLDVLNSHFQTIFGITKLQSTLLQLAYFVSEFCEEILDEPNTKIHYERDREHISYGLHSLGCL